MKNMTTGETKDTYKIPAGKLTMKDHLEDQEVDGRITLKWIRLD
jgi:hypothetical protein